MDKWLYNQFCPGYPPTRGDPVTMEVQVAREIATSHGSFWLWETVWPTLGHANPQLGEFID